MYKHGNAEEMKLTNIHNTQRVSEWERWKNGCTWINKVCRIFINERASAVAVAAVAEK
jgi:hypothetical protein